MTSAVSSGAEGSASAGTRRRRNEAGEEEEHRGQGRASRSRVSPWQSRLFSPDPGSPRGSSSQISEPAEASDGNSEEEGDRENSDHEYSHHHEGPPRDHSRYFSLRVTDPDVVSCSVCFGQLLPPIYQCKNGHVACNTCLPRLADKCHVCSEPTKHVRCIAFEKLIESLWSSCEYADEGCRVRFPFVEKAAHEKECIYAPCKCPVLDCTYKGFMGGWSDHFYNSHLKRMKDFSYNQKFTLLITAPVNDDDYKPLWTEYGECFCLSIRDKGCGYAFSVVGLRNDNASHGFSCELVAKAKGGAVHKFEMPIPNVRDWTVEQNPPERREQVWPEWDPRTVAGAFLLVPRCSFEGYSEGKPLWLNLDITIRKAELTYHRGAPPP